VIASKKGFGPTRIRGTDTNLAYAIPDRTGSQVGLLRAWIAVTNMVTHSDSGLAESKRLVATTCGSSGKITP
jgi:hypothetical protein